MPLVIQGATSGQATVQATDAQTVTITLPSTTGTLAVSGGSPSFSTITTTNDASISGLTVGKGGGAVATGTVLGVSAGVGNSVGTSLTAIGYLAGTASTADANTFIGSVSGTTNTSGTENTALGTASMRYTTTGSQLTAIGRSALSANTTGSANTAVGKDALISNTTASNNTAVGYQAGYSNTTGVITAIGAYALYANTTGTGNTAVGGYDGTNSSALRFNTTGNYNIAVGTGALSANTTASNNTAVGYQAGYSNTTASNQSAVGYLALNATTTGVSNTAVGSYAGLSNVTGSQNAFFGYYAGRGVTGDSNTLIGYGAGYYAVNYQGSNSILIGTNTDANASADTNELVIGYRQTGKGSNTGFISMGNVSIYQGNNSAAWAITSDQRIKKNIIDVANGLSIITALRPVEFDYKEDDTHDIGFIAQEYQQVLPDQIVKHAPNEAEKAWVDDEVLGVQANLTPYLVKAIQELNTLAQTQAAQIAALTAKVGA